MSEPLETSWSNRPATVAAGVGFILLFVLILWLAYVPLRPDSLAEVAGRERLATLRDISGEGIKQISEYGVVDATAGVFRIPLEQAMEITVRELGGVPGNPEAE